MKLAELRLTDYRNIQNACFSPSPQLTVVCGKNGQGKTNLLESIFLLTGSKSFRGAKDVQLVREDAAFSVVEGTVAPFETSANKFSLEEKKDIRLLIAGENAEKRGRSAKVNGVDFGRATNLAGIFTAVVFEPDHLRLIKGSPEGRRRFLDAALCQLYPQYLVLLRRYVRTLTQKNALLKDYHKTPDAWELLEVYDEALAQTGEEITSRRASYLTVLAPLAQQNYHDLSSGAETMTLSFEPCFTEDLLQTLKAARPRDLAAGFCTVGPHREDFSVFVNGRDAKQFGSQGQQRSAVLSIKLAEASAAAAVTEVQPVLLLDDVLSELDETRQSYLLQRMKDRQTIVTACDPALFERTDGVIYRMDAGVLQAW